MYIVSVAVEAFDAVKSLQRLDSSPALHKSQVGAQLRRKKPSREYLRTMGSSGNLLLDLEEEPPELPPRSDSDSNVIDTTSTHQLGIKLPPRSSSDSKALESTPPHTKPRPMPRAAPRQKTPAHKPDATIPEVAKKPQVLPRYKRDHSDTVDTEGLKKSPMNQPPQPVTSSPVLSPKHEDVSLTPKASPILDKKEPLLKSSPKPSAKHPLIPKSSPKMKPKLVVEDDVPELPQKPVPRHHRQDESEIDSKLEELQKKDPLKLTVKEKALLAQKAISATEKAKIPPPVRRKPKHDDHSIFHNEPEGSPVRERSRSFDNALDESPKRARKLPPGAFNIALPQGGPVQMRMRSATVATEEPDTLEHSYEEDHSVLSHGLEETDSDVKAPPKRPPPPVHKRRSDERPSKQASVPEDEPPAEPLTTGLSEDVEPPLAAATHQMSPEIELDNNQILVWTADHIAMWLTQIGLGQHTQAFMDRGIQGYMLFDLDGSRLKVGVVRLCV